MLTVRRLIPAALALIATSAQAQYFKTHGATLSVGATGQFSRILDSDPRYVPFTYPVQNGTVTTSTFLQNQFNMDKVGFVTTLMFHPKPWAGVALNYGFSHNEERYQYHYANTNTIGESRVPTDAHEFTGGYLFHPKHIPFQPYVEVGGGAIDFAPWQGSNQFRGAGLLETGFDLPIKSEHIGFRVSGRSLYYRSPNFYTPQISTRSWRVTVEPAISAFYRF